MLAITTIRKYFGMENVTQHDTNKKETLKEKEDERKSSIGQFPNFFLFFDLGGHHDKIEATASSKSV